MTSSTRFGLLGPLYVRNAEHEIRVPPGRVRALLAGLLLSPNQVVPYETLVHWLWCGALPDDPRGALFTCVGRLRRVLGRGAVIVQRRGIGYLIDIGPEQVDALRFTELVNTARQCKDSAEELQILQSALALWRGSALMDVESDALRLRYAVELELQYLDAVERRGEVSLSLGRHAELIADLTALIVEHPLRERLWIQLIVSLDRSGRRAEALDTFVRLRGVLREELGLEPSAAARQIHQEILAGDPRAAARVYGSNRPVAEQVSSPNRWQLLTSLPPDVDNFVGRVDVFDFISRRLEEAGRSGFVPVVSVSGAPGTGKSALIVRIAHRMRDRFRDGVLFVRLGGGQAMPRDPADVLADLLNACGVPPAALPLGLDQRSAALRARLAGRSVLLVLDDALDVAQVTPLLPGTSGCAVLIASRSVLSVLPGASDVRLSELPPDEAVELLTGLLGPAQVAEHADAVEALARSCAGSPLALQIAGARLVGRPAAAIDTLVAQLADTDRRLDELAVGPVSVRAGIAASYKALEPSAAITLRRLGALSQMTIASWAISVFDETVDESRVAERLLQMNLIEDAGVDLTGESRFRLHDLVADYARELSRVDDLDDSSTATTRYITALLNAAGAAYGALDVSTDLPPPYQPEPVPQSLHGSVARLRRVGGFGAVWLVAEQEALVWAIERSCALGWSRRALQLADYSLEFLDNRLPPAKIGELYSSIRQAAERNGDDLTVWRATLCGVARALHRTPSDDATDALTTCARAFAALKAPRELNSSLVQLAWVHRIRGASAKAASAARRAVTAAAASGDPLAILAGKRELAAAMTELGKIDQAMSLLEEALTLAQRNGSREAVMLVLDKQVTTALIGKDIDRAQRASEALLDAAEATEDERAPGYAAVRAAEVAIAVGDGGAGVHHAERAVEVLRAVSDLHGTGIASAALAEALLVAGRRADAIRIARDGIDTLEGFESSGTLKRLQVIIEAA